jgi:hypothetical protein
MASACAPSVGAMSRRAFLPLGASFCALVVGCSSSSNEMPNVGSFGDQATCNFMQDKNNCLEQMLASIDACIASDATTPVATMSADGSTCSASDGRVSVTFDPPLASTSTKPQGWDATIKNAAGATCAHYVEHAQDEGYTLTDGSGKTATLVYTAPHQVKFTCPDGSGWQDNDQDLCLPVLPGSASTSYGSAGIDVSILDMKHSLFHCAPH